MLASLLTLVLSSAACAEPPDPKRIWQEAIESATRLESIELRVSIPDTDQVQQVWVVPAQAGKPDSGRLRVESRDRAEPHGLRRTLVGNERGSVALDESKKTFRLVPAGVRELTRMAGASTPYWIEEFRATARLSEAERAAREEVEYLAAETLAGVECDVIRVTVRSTGKAEVGGKVFDVPVHFTNTYAIARTDRLPRRWEQRLGAALERPDVVAGLGASYEIVAVNAAQPDDRFAAPTEAELVARGYAKAEPPKPAEKPSKKAFQGAPSKPVAAGDAAPDFTLKDLGGKEVTLSALKGKVVLLDFWATWCGPCKASMPLIEELHREFAGREVVFLALNTGESNPDTARKFFTEKGYTSRCLLEADAVSVAYGVSGLPTLLIVGRDGKVTHVHRGFGAAGFSESLRKLIGEALGEGVPRPAGRK